MAIHNLRKMFRPRSVAVVDVDDSPRAVGRRVLENLVGAGYSGHIYPISRTCDALLGLSTLQSVRDLTESPDLAVLCSPPPDLPEMIDQCGEAGVGSVLILGPGLHGTNGACNDLETRIREAAARYDNMRLLGPQSMGVIAPAFGLNVSIADAPVRSGNISFICQSEALCACVLEWASSKGVGFSHFVSLGRMLDVNLADLIDYFALDASTHSLILYIESLTEVRQFMSAARAFSRTKPIVAYRAGSFDGLEDMESPDATSYFVDDDVYSAAFRRAGIERVFEFDDVFDCAMLLRQRRPVRRQRLAILTNATGPGMIAADALRLRGGQRAHLTSPTRDALDRCLPEGWSQRNMIDLHGDANANRYLDAMRHVLPDEQVDAVLAVVLPQALPDAEETARMLGQAAALAVKPVLVAWLGSHGRREARQILEQAHIPCYKSPVHAIHGFMHLSAYATNIESLYETPRDLLVDLDIDREVLAKRRNDLLQPNTELPPHAARELLEAYGIPFVDGPAGGNGAGRTLHETPTPPDGALDGLAQPPPLGGSLASMLGNGRADTIEMILAGRKHPLFGSVMMVSVAGLAAELFHDVSLALPPLTEQLARRMLERLRSWPLLAGRGRHGGVDIDRIIEVLIRFSYLLADAPSLSYVEVNPVLASADRVVAAGVRMVTDSAVVDTGTRFEHLAVRPYPTEHRRRVKLSDGLAVKLRPIHPADEPMWHELLKQCSPQTLRARFFGMVGHLSHAMAVRYCYVDYDREIALVAEAEIDGRRRLIGTCRIIADPDHRTAEYAAIIADAYQGKRLGSMLMDFSVEIARQWGVRAVEVETSPDNRRMLASLRRHGFDVDEEYDDDAVMATLQL